MQKATFPTKTFSSLSFKALPGEIYMHFLLLKRSFITFFILGPMNTDMLDKKVKVCTCTSQLVVHCSFAQETKW